MLDASNISPLSLSSVSTKKGPRAKETGVLWTYSAGQEKPALYCINSPLELRMAFWDISNMLCKHHDLGQVYWMDFCQINC